VPPPLRHDPPHLHHHTRWRRGPQDGYDGGAGAGGSQSKSTRAAPLKARPLPPTHTHHTRSRRGLQEGDGSGGESDSDDFVPSSQRSGRAARVRMSVERFHATPSLQGSTGGKRQLRWWQGARSISYVFVLRICVYPLKKVVYVLKIVAFDLKICVKRLKICASVLKFCVYVLKIVVCVLKICVCLLKFCACLLKICAYLAGPLEDRDRAAGIKKSILGRGRGYRNIGSRKVPRIRWIAPEQSMNKFWKKLSILWKLLLFSSLLKIVVGPLKKAVISLKKRNGLSGPA